MTDRELLEKAGRSARQERSAAGDLWSNARGKLWNPLDDDGDALRLAVKLGFDIRRGELPDTIFVSAIGRKCMATEALFDVRLEKQPDECAATRRAIVRAAAALAP